MTGRPLVKRGISGDYHSVGHAYLQSYLKEYAWRYNHRLDDRAMFETLIGNAAKPQTPQVVTPI